MKRWKRRICAALACVVLCGGLAGCNAWGETDSKTEPEPVTLKIRLFNEVSNTDGVLEQFYKKTKDTLGVKLDIVSYDRGEYRQKVALMLSSKEQVDLMFNAPWMNLGECIAEGGYAELDSYFNNDDYPGLKRAFSQEYLDANRFDGKIYGVPLMTNIYDTPGIAYRKDLLEKYGLGFDTITSLDQLQQFYDAVLEHEDGGIIPLSVGRRGFYMLFNDELALRKNYIYDVSGWSGTTFPIKVVISPDGKQVKDVLVMGDSSERFARLEGSFQEDFWKIPCLRYAEWNKYLEKNSMMRQDANALFEAGQAASFETPLGEGTTKYEQALQQNDPEGQVEFFTYFEEFQGDLSKLNIPWNLRANNFLCVPKESKNIEKTMCFLDWLFASQENNDLFDYGVKGVDWIDQGDNTYSILASNPKPYTMPAYALCKNPNYQRIQADLSEQEKQLLEITMDEKNFVESPLSGFILDQSRISMECLQLEELYADYYIPLQHGGYGEQTEEMIAAFHQ